MAVTIWKFLLGGYGVDLAFGKSGSNFYPVMNVGTCYEENCLNYGLELGYSSANKIPAGKWEFVSWTINLSTTTSGCPGASSENPVPDEQAAIYLDGVEQDSGFACGTLDGYGYSGDAIGNVNDSIYYGGLAYVGYWHSALTSDQIAADCGAGGNCPALPPDGGAVLDSAQTACLCQNYGASASPTIGKPVVLEDGDFTHSVTDITVPGAGIPLSFTRTYDSVAAQDGVATAMGYGWTDNLGMAVSTSGTTDTVTEANGAQIQFSTSDSPTPTGAPRPPRRPIRVRRHRSTLTHSPTTQPAVPTRGRSWPTPRAR